MMRFKIQHVLYNLLSNALKFTPNNGEVKVEVDKTERNTQPFLRVSVKDSGIGISQRELPHIFDRFYQVDGTATRKGEGTGIGLTLMKELVELMQGRVAVKSEIGQGTEFVIELPIVNKATPKVAAKASLPTMVIQEELVPDLQALPNQLKGPIHDLPQLLNH